jgi:hypothetical protein
MRLLTLPITIVRVPLELGFGAAKEAVKLAHGLVAGGEEPVEEKPRQAPAPRRRRTSSRAGAKSGNGRARTGAAARRKPSRRPAEEAMKAAPPIDEPASAATAAEAAVAPAAEPAPSPPAEPAGAPPEPVASPPEPVAADEPAHIDEEPELVAETAEAGAEDGAGAEVDVDAPWPGYDEMTAPDIEDRLQAEGPEAAAAVSLYEASHKGRASILEAASRTMIT